jgi:hypothetical protein
VRDCHFKISSFGGIVQRTAHFHRNSRSSSMVGRPVSIRPQLRWRLTDIAADLFTWRGESSRDSGVTWQFDEQMLATRVDVE